VIGGGTAGIVAAKTAAGFGASVLLVERDRDRLLQSRAAVTTFLVVAKAPMTRFGRIVAELAPRPGR
jgi:alanine dehydrogenase